MNKIRDISHEQVSQSTDAELAERLLQIVKRAQYFGYPHEYHAITSEMYCRAEGIPSEPCTKHCGLDAIALRVIASGKGYNYESGIKPGQVFNH